jgi:hypothetical protein
MQKMIEEFDNQTEINPLLALRSQGVPLEESQPLYQPAQETEVLYFYGVGPYYQGLKSWLRGDLRRKLIFLEDEPDRFECFIQQPEVEAVLTDKQVEIISCAAPLQTDLEKVIYAHLFRRSECFVAWGKNREFQRRLADLQMQAEMHVCLYRDHGISSVKNILKNGVEPAIAGEELEGIYGGIPAIICGAGPSLQKNLEELKGLQGRALIFAGGTALGVLEKEGISPDFGGGIDPDPPLDRYGSLDLPFFYQSPCSSKVLSQVRGPRILMGSSQGFPLERWLLEPLAPFDGGTHVGTFLTHVATLLGCSPIIFVGMDGCSADGVVYYGEIEEKWRQDPLITTDRSGKPVQSRLDFLLGRRFFEQFANIHPTTLFLNATEGGLSFSGIENFSLSEVKKRWLSQRYAKKTLSYPSISRADPNKIVLLKKSLRDCLLFCEEILLYLEKHMGSDLAIRALPQDQALEEELFFQLVLIPVWEVWKYFIQNGTIVEQMESPQFEKKVQRILFYQDICHQYEAVF